MKRFFAIRVVTLFVLVFSLSYPKEYSKKSSKIKNESVVEVTAQSKLEEKNSKSSEQIKAELKEEIKREILAELKSEILEELKKERLTNNKSDEKEKIVVLPVVNKSKIKDNGRCERLTSLIEEKLLESSKYEVINRSEMYRILEEQQMGVTGIIDENSAAAIGKVAGAKKAVIASIQGYSINRSVNGTVAEIVVDIKIIDIETARNFETINLREISEAQVSNIAINSAVEKAGRDLAKKLNGETIDTNREAEEYLKRVEFIREDNKSWKVGSYYAMVSFKSGTFSSDSGFIKFNSDNQKYMNGAGVEISKENIFINFEYCTGGKFKLAKIGTGAGYKLLKKSGIEVLAGIEGDIAFFDGEIGETTYTTEISSKSFKEGSKIYISKTALGVAPFLRCNFNLSNSMNLFITGEYKIYQKIDKYSVEIEDGERENIKIDGLKSDISLNGAGIKAGFDYKF